MKSVIYLFLIIIVSAIAIVLAENYIMKEFLLIAGYLIAIIEVFLLNLIIKEI